MIWILIFGALCVLFYYKSVKPLSYWKDRGVAYLKTYPIVGNFGSVIFQRKAFFEYVKDTYKEFPNQRYYGVYQFSSNGLYLRDVELIKKIIVKDFDYFTDHRSFTPTELDQNVNRNLFNLTGQRWRDMRATLSPSFTGSKMKIIFSLVSNCSKIFTEYFEKQTTDIQEVEMKDIVTRFTNDAIASTAFGLECNSLKDQNNAFYVMAKEATDISGWRMVKVIMHFLVPKIAKFLNLSMSSSTVNQFFSRVVRETIKQREDEGVVRPDMIHLLMEARKGKGKDINEEDHEDAGFATVKESVWTRSGRRHHLEISDEDIISHALGFIFGGFDTTSSLLCFAAYEIAVNKKIQEKLIDEVDETLKNCNGHLTYEALHKMKYMDMVVSETLRKWPPGFLMDRQCVKDYIIEPVNPWEKPLLIEKGMQVFVPVVGFHHDPEYYPNPGEFDPERFSDENKHNIKPFTYFPFGAGPRSCIASRFALMETKTLLFHLLSKFEIVPTNKTQIPLKVAKSTINFVAEGGFWLGLKKRERL